MQGTNPVAIVTGAGRGIGRRTAELLAAAGYAVAAVARTADEIESLADTLRASGAEAIALPCDVTIPDQISTAVARTLEEWRRIDTLINNAGITGPRATLEHVPAADWNRVMATNIFGTVDFVRAVLPAMRAAGRGTIVNVLGGRVGAVGIPAGETAYVASKFAIWGFTEALASELVDAGIRVNAVSPGPVRTRLWDGFIGDETTRKLAESGIDLGPDAAAAAIVFLAGDESAPLTGKNVSARWDDLSTLARDGERLNACSSYTLRRVDGRNFREL